MSCRLLVLRCSSAPSSVNRRLLTTSSRSGERLRIAIVGGAAAGLSSALHLAPLVEQGLVASPIDVYEPVSSKGREIGVGIWSTALEPFRTSSRNTHQMLWEDVMHYGRWVGDVGYRTPNGSWLARSHLPTEMSDEMEMPGLLFLREMDMLTALRRAVHGEVLKGTVEIHDRDSSRITGIMEESPRSFSAALVGGKENITERDYHLIVAADGMDSILRKAYGGHRRMRRFTGTGALPTPFDRRSSDTEQSWESMGQAEANAIEDRKYTVFRGNANMTLAGTGIDKSGMDGASFQTWGVGKSMRFATVPLSFPSDMKRTDKQVWFITTSDDSIAAETDASKRRQLLLDAFASWHPPICQILEATPPEEILFERAMAHRHSVGPVLNVSQDLKQYRKQRTGTTGPGPAIVFSGDAQMTVDPILAQGFTVAMEGAHELAIAVERGCQTGSADDSSLAFDPYQLRNELLERQDRRSDRLICLLRATELVQALGQPTSGLIGSFHQRILRPLMKLSPDFVKRPMFNAVLRYSLGLPLRKK